MRTRLIVHSVTGSEPPPAGFVLDEEISAISGAVERRKVAHLAGRACARAGLRVLGIDDAPIARRDDRSPGWPVGVTGSITHTPGFVGAVVADVAGVVVGIDAERIDRATRDIASRILTRDEIAWVDESESPTAELVAVFSAKEAFYKAQHQVTSAWVGFHDVTTRRRGGDLVLEPATDLAALTNFSWPIVAGQRVEPDGIVVSAIAATVSTGA